ncbi:MAG TPA: lipid-transfer protein [Mycobacteriales bacterium]|nr:lipid-transfer protein [Mycobacteriales bacterium]
MSHPLRDKTAVAGIGQTAYVKSLPDTELSLGVQAIKAALDDAGLTPADVDGLASYTMEQNVEVNVARNLGLGDVTWFAQVGFGGGAGCGVIGQAAMAVATGQANVVVCWRSRKRGGPATRPWAQVGDRVEGTAAFTRPVGLLRPVDEIAMLTRRYLHEYGGSREDLGRVAMAVRAHANRNPLAMMHGKPMTMADYLGARMVSEPLCLFDNCLESDGAVACVVVSAERARDLRQPPAYVHAFGQGLNAQHQTMTNYFRDDPLEGPAWTCARVLWSQAAVTPADVDVAQLYDAFSPLILLSLEGYGFCARGEAPSWTLDGGLELGGRLPVNTSGGGMSEAYVHGFNLINEGVRQIRGTSTAQVPGAQVSFVSSGEGVPTSAVLFTKEPAA